MYTFHKQIGTQQHYELGRLIRKRYMEENTLLSPNYTRDEVYIRSTDVDRTLMSVLSQLSALFPPDDDQVINYLQYEYIILYINLESCNTVINVLYLICTWDVFTSVRMYMLNWSEKILVTIILVSF